MDLVELTNVNQKINSLYVKKSNAPTGLRALNQHVMSIQRCIQYVEGLVSGSSKNMSRMRV